MMQKKSNVSRALIVMTVGVWFFATPARADEGQIQPDSAVNDILTAIREQHKLPALWGAIIHGDQVTAIGAVGVRKAGAEPRVTIHDKIHMGSCTKAMTATMLALLIEEEKLKWDATLGEVFPKLKEKMHEGFHGVKLWQLLTHTSGAPANAPWFLFGGKKSTTEQRRNLVKLIMRSAPQSTPGEKFTYSNAGYAVAGLMGETVSGLSWEQLMQKRLFEPLKMSSAGFGPPILAGSKKGDQPVGHTRGKKGLAGFPLDNPPVLGPAGTVHCSMIDWAKFVSLHLRAGRNGKTQAPFNNEPGLKLHAKTFTRLHTPPDGKTYAGGWGIVKRSGIDGPLLTHSGSNGRWFCTVSFSPIKNLAVLSATNVGGNEAGKACAETASKLVSHFLARQGKPAKDGAEKVR